MINFTEKDNSITFTVRVIPRSSRSEAVGEYEGALKVKLTAPPIDGEANKELISLLAKELKIPKSDIEIVSGQSSKLKKIRVTSIDPEALQQFS